MTAVPTIRVATTADLPELQRLLAQPGQQLDDTTSSALTTRRYHLVIDAPFDGLCAVVIVALIPPHAYLEALAIDERCACPELEARLVGVAEALADAFGCKALEVAGRSAA